MAPDGRWTWKAQGLQEGENPLSLSQSMPDHEDSAAVPLNVTVDTIAPAAPDITDTWSAAGTTKPEFEGTAEPGATVAIGDDDGDILATVIADGSGAWASGPLAGLDPTMTGLTATQTDLAGNESLPASIGPFAFVPAFERPTEGEPFAVGTTEIPLELRGWADARVRVVVSRNGSDVTAGTLTLGEDGVTNARYWSSGGSLATGDYTVTAWYVDAAGDPLEDDAVNTVVVAFTIG